MTVISFLFSIAGSSQSGTLNDLNLVNVVILSQKEDGTLKMDMIVNEKKDGTEGTSFKYAVLTTEGKSIAQCVSLAEIQTGKDFFFGHLKSVIFELSFLKQEGNITAFTEYAKRNSCINHYVTLFALDDKDEKLTKSIKEEDDKTTNFFNSVVKKYPLEGIYTVKFNQMVNSLGTFCMPLLSVEESIGFNGVCIMKDDTYKDRLDRQDTKFFKILTGEANNVYIKAPEGDIHIHRCISKLKYRGEDAFSFNIKLSCEIEAYKNPIDLTDNGEKKTEEELSKFFTAQMEQFIKKIKYKYEADIADIGGCLKRYDNDRYRQMTQSGADILKMSDVDVKVDVNIIRNEVFK